MRLARTLVRHRRRVWLPLLAVTVLAALAARHLSVDFSPQAIYAADDDVLAFDEAFKERFGHPDAVTVVTLEATGEADVLAPPALRWLRTTSGALEALDRVAAVLALTGLELPPPGARGAEALAFAPLLPDGPITAADAERLRERLAEADLLEPFLLGPERRAAGIAVAVSSDARDATSLRRVVAGLENVLARHPPPGGYRVLTSGLPVLRARIVEDIESDQRRMLPLAALMFFVVMLLVFRRLSGSLFPLLAVGVGLVWTGGLLAATGSSLNIISNILPTLLFVIGTANSVHIVNRYAEECARTPGDRHEAIVRTLRHMGPACLLTFLTTAVGFLSLATARYEVLREVAFQTALGLVLLYVSTMLVLGTALASFAPPRAPREGHGGAGALLARLGDGVARRPGVVLAGTLLVLVLAAFLAVGVPVDSRMLETYEPDHPLNEAVAVAEDRLGGVIAVEVSVRSEDAGALVRADAVSATRRFQERVAEHEGVLGTRSWADLLLAVAERLPPSSAPREAAPAQARLGQAWQAARLLDDRLGLGAFLDEGGRWGRVRVQVRDLGSSGLLDLVHRIEADAAATGLAGPDREVRLTGDATVYAHALEGFIHDLFRSLLGAAVIIFVTLGLLFRSLRLGLLTILPNLTPLVVTLGWMRLRGYELNASTAIVFAVGLGVAVDDTIHLLSRYREELRRHGPGPTALREAMRGAGRAMLLTTALMILGLVFLAFSDFVPTRRFAELTAVAMLAALLGDLLLLPASLRLLPPAAAVAPSGAGRRGAC